MVLELPLEPGSQRPRRRQEAIEGPGLLELIQGCHAGCHRDRIAGERAALEEVPANRVSEVEDVGTSEERATRKATPDDLAETCEVRIHMIGMLGPAECDAKTTHDLVENQREVVFCRDLPQSLEEFP